MNWIPWLRRVKPPRYSDVDVAVVIMNIGKGVVFDIVLHFPHVVIATEDVDAKASQLVDCAVFTEGIVISSVHDIESNPRGSKAKQYGKNNFCQYW